MNSVFDHIDFEVYVGQLGRNVKKAVGFVLLKLIREVQVTLTYLGIIGFEVFREWMRFPAECRRSADRNPRPRIAESQHWGSDGEVHQGESWVGACHSRGQVRLVQRCQGSWPWRSASGFGTKEVVLKLRGAPL